MLQKPTSKSDQRCNLILKLWQRNQTTHGGKGFLRLDDLLREMRSASVQAPFLSSLYFSGADVDHPFFLKSDDIALGLAVLPQDAEKAGQAKRHPHQTEVIFVLDGSLRLLYQSHDKTEARVLKRGDYFAISKNVCHWVEPVEGVEAAYLFVKTAPARQPREEDCNKSGGQRQDSDKAPK